MDNITEELVKSSTKTLDWLIESMGEASWARRRDNVVSYFNELSDKLYNPKPSTHFSLEGFDPLAVYKDWLAWYMYLIESMVQRPTSGDIIQLGRILPIFAAIGRRMELIKPMNGIDLRLKGLINDKNKNPDAHLFELLIASCYARNGWTVNFLRESNLTKTPDLEVKRKTETYLVECKRFLKVNSYAEKERLEWQKRAHHLFEAMDYFKIPAIAEIKFNTPLEEIPETILGQVYAYCAKAGFLTNEKTFDLPQLSIKLRKIDLNTVNDHLKNDCIKPNSPQLINLLAGEFDMHGNYTVRNHWAEIGKVGTGDKLEVLNEIICSLHNVYVAKWESLSETSIDLKAKDIKKALANAVSQIPDSKEGIIHIGYETVCGPIVELQRQQKIQTTVKDFEFANKNITNIYCHGLQPLVTLNGFDCAETVIFSGNNPKEVLPEMLLLDVKGIKTSNNTHWHQDLKISS